jgi:toxin ParE1/3/4
MSGRAVPEIDNETIRELIYKNYRIVYQVLNKDQARILTVFQSGKKLDETTFPD